MSNSIEYAKRELNRFIDEKDPCEIQEKINENIIQIVSVFAEQGHSGLTASYVTNALERLLRFLPLQPLTGEESEWMEVGDGTEQNIRCSRVFRKNKDNSAAYDIEGKVFSDDEGKSWYTSRESRVEIEFPYIPPTHPERIYKEKNHE